MSTTPDTPSTSEPTVSEDTILKLVVPTAGNADLFAAQVMAYRAKMLQAGDSLDGCAGLESCTAYDEWIQFDSRGRAAYGESYMPSTTLLAVREHDGKLVGMVDIRHKLNDFLHRIGGHIGYSVTPEERRKGYATQMLELALDQSRRLGMGRVLVTCKRDNEASRRTILANGGILEDEVRAASEDDDSGFGADCVIQRFWISL